MGTDNTKRQPNRLGGLRRFAISITVFNLLGHTVFGFEQSWAQLLVSLATAYIMEILLELVDAKANRRRPYFAGGLHQAVDFLLPAHITGLAISMLIYANDQLAPFVFAVAVAIGSKAIFRIPLGRGTRHFFNPSNLGITITLLLFPWVGIAPPYHFTENLYGLADWILPLLILISGSFINSRFTGRIPLITVWLVGFAAQALLRSLIFGTSVIAAWLPMTGLAFILYTFYMITDPATTPDQRWSQVAFGFTVALVYCMALLMHVVFGLFFALTVTCALRGIAVYSSDLIRRISESRATVPSTAVQEV